MYYAAILSFMLVLPLLSTVGEAMMGTGADIWLLALKWFVFWGVGVRMALAGARQIMQPGYTAREIFEIEDPRASGIVKELGFWNLSGGVIALLSIIWPGWAVPAAVAGGLFYGLAGWQHLSNAGRNSRQTTAMASDLMMFVVLAALVLKQLFWP